MPLQHNQRVVVCNIIIVISTKKRDVFYFFLTTHDGLYTVYRCVHFNSTIIMRICDPMLFVSSWEESDSTWPEVIHKDEIGGTNVDMEVFLEYFPYLVNFRLEVIDYEEALQFHKKFEEILDGQYSLAWGPSFEECCRKLDPCKEKAVESVFGSKPFILNRKENRLTDYSDER